MEANENSGERKIKRFKVRERERGEIMLLIYPFQCISFLKSPGAHYLRWNRTTPNTVILVSKANTKITLLVKRPLHTNVEDGRSGRLAPVRV